MRIWQTQIELENLLLILLKVLSPHGRQSTNSSQAIL